MMVKTRPNLNDQTVRQNLTRNIADRALRLLDTQLQSRDDGPLFYALPRPDRAILIFDPTQFNNPRKLLQPNFHERLAAGLGGRRVKVSLHGSLFVQVGYQPEPGPAQLEMVPVPFETQPGPFHVPLGRTSSGDFWLSLLDMDSILIGGARRMGKTRVLHGFIQALVRGAASDLLLWDGKGGVEFGRYTGSDQVTVIDSAGLGPALQALYGEMVCRQGAFQSLGATSLPEHNRLSTKPLPLKVLVIDELALVPEAIQASLGLLIALGGAFGIHPVLATQRPGAENVQGLLRSNLSTRIALPVPDAGTSRIILGRTGAEKLPKSPGRMQMVWEAKVREIQSYRIELPSPPGADVTGEFISLLTPDELVLARTAAEALEGWFNIRELAGRTGQGRDAINALAKRWEAMGFLTPIQRNTRGHQLGRQVTQVLRRTAGLEHAPDATPPGSTDHPDRPDRGELGSDRALISQDQAESDPDQDLFRWIPAAHGRAKKR